MRQSEDSARELAKDWEISLKSNCDPNRELSVESFISCFNLRTYRNGTLTFLEVTSQEGDHLEFGEIEGDLLIKNTITNEICIKDGYSFEVSYLMAEN